VRSSSWAEPKAAGLTWPDVLEAGLVGLSEGAWIAVLYALIETVGQARSPLGLPIFAVIAFLGALAGPRLDQLGDGRWRVMTITSVAIGLVGMVLGSGVLAGLLAGDPGQSFGAQPGGWLLGVAAFRGMLGGGTLEDPDGATRSVVRGVILVSLAWLYAGLLPAASQEAFRSVALLPTFLFIAAGVLSAALRRVQAISVSTGTAWWRNRAWLIFLGTLLVGLTLLALPLARGLASSEPQVLGLNGFPELVILVAFVTLLLLPARDRQRPGGLSLRTVVVLTVLFVIVAALYRLLHSQDATGPAQGAGAAGSGAEAGSPVMGIFILGWVLAGVALVTILVARSWRRSHPEAGLVGYREEADFELRAPGSGWLRRAGARLRQLRPVGPPRTAEAAYLAALRELEQLPARRRLEVETPAAHARRLHREGAGSLDLDLLAADYELAHWGARTMTDSETRRAVARWERLRTRVQGWIAAEQAARAYAEAQEIKDPG
jgi:hypothetical protein